MPIFCIAGLSGTGKSTIAKIIAKELDIPQVISYTTRPIRPTEKDNVDYHFINDETYNFLADSLVAQESYKVDGGHIWRYGFHQSDMVGNKNVITVINPKGIADLQKDGIKNIVTIVIKVDEEERINRIQLRKDNQTKAEISRRTKQDIELFNGLSPNYIVENKNLDDCVTLIKRIINMYAQRENYRQLSNWIDSHK